MVEETCTGAFYEVVELNVCACGRTLFLCGDISSLIRAHLLRVFSLLQKHTHAHKQNLTISKFSLLLKIVVFFIRRAMHGGGKDKTGRNTERG